VSDSPETAADPLTEIALIPDAQERLGWIAERGRRAHALPPEARVPAHRVPGCSSAVWLVDETSEGVCHFRGDAEAPILKGLTVLACTRATGRPAAAVAADATDIVVALGLERYITPTRLNGLRQLQRHIRACAARHAGLPTPP
jgi:cysteine desulfuration protein SufE